MTGRIHQVVETMIMDSLPSRNLSSVVYQVGFGLIYKRHPISDRDWSLACWYSNLFFFQAEDGIRDLIVTGVQTCALPIYVVGFNVAVYDAVAVYVVNRLDDALEDVDGFGERQRAVGRDALGDGLPVNVLRSEERRVGKECRSRWSPYH